MRLTLARCLAPVLVAALVAALACGMWAGQRWAEGEQAIIDRQAQQTRLDELERTAENLRSQVVETAVQYHQAATRLNDIADKLEQDREAQRKFDQRQAAELAALLRDRPDLRTGRAGDDVMRHWNRSNAGPTGGADAPPAADSGKPEAAVPGPATGAERSVGDPAGKPRPGREPLSRLPQHSEPAGRSGAGLGTDGMELVLRHAAAHGADAG